MAFVIALDKPIRQGQQRYQMLVLQTTKEMDEITINLDEETLEKEYNSQLDPVMQGMLCNLIAKTFKVISKKKVFVPGKFENAYGKPCVKCALRASEGHLYPLEKSFVFIHKPPVLIRFDEVDSVEFQRYAGGQGSTRNFDLSVKLKKASGDASAKEYMFSGIDRSDFDSLYNFLSGKKIRIINTQDALNDNPRPTYTLDVDDVDDESDDEDFGSDDGSVSSDESIDEEDNDVEMVPEDDDSDLEEARARSKKDKRAKREDSDDGDAPKKKKKKQQKLSAASPKKKKQQKLSAVSPKKKKAKKDPNAPKRAMTAYMFYNQAIRAPLKKENPDLSFGDLGKLIGQKYKALTVEEKQKYNDQAVEAKAKYEKAMANYTPPEPESDDSDDDATKKSASSKKKKAKKDPNAPKRGLSAYMYFNQEKRSQLKEENPDLSFGDLGKLVGQKYKAMTPEEKAKYDKMAKDDKERYVREMKAYKSKEKPKEEPDDDISDSAESDSD
jgi:structure-specific recognition protein 1